MPRTFSPAQLQRVLERREKAIAIGDRAALLIIDSQLVRTLKAAPAGLLIRSA